jgi:predicted DNA-binding transcriptional regulator YafY
MANPFANAIKLLTAINLLVSPSGTTIKRMMDQLGISRRTAFRLLDTLESLGFPLIDEHQKSRGEKTYRLVDSYVIRLPNLTIPNPGFTEPETEMLLSILDFCKSIQQPKGLILLNGIRQKVKAMSPLTKRNKTSDSLGKEES